MKKLFFNERTNAIFFIIYFYFVFFPLTVISYNTDETPFLI